GTGERPGLRVTEVITGLLSAGGLVSRSAPRVWRKSERVTHIAGAAFSRCAFRSHAVRALAAPAYPGDQARPRHGGAELAVCRQGSSGSPDPDRGAATRKQKRKHSSSWRFGVWMRAC